MSVHLPVPEVDYRDQLPAQVRRRIIVAGPCHLWTGASSGRTLGGGTTNGQFVHRLVWSSAHGPIPPGRLSCGSAGNAAASAWSTSA